MLKTLLKPLPPGPWLHLPPLQRHQQQFPWHQPPRLRPLEPRSLMVPRPWLHLPVQALALPEEVSVVAAVVLDAAAASEVLAVR